MLGLQCRFAKSFSHVHDRKPYLLALLWPQPREELIHALFAAILTPKPDRPVDTEAVYSDSVPI